MYQSLIISDRVCRGSGVWCRKTQDSPRNQAKHPWWHPPALNVLRRIFKVYWPITSASLDHTKLCYLQDPKFSASRPEADGCCPQQGALTDCKQAPSQALTDFNFKRHLHISKRQQLPIRSRDLLSLIYIGGSLIDGSVKRQYSTHTYMHTHTIKIMGLRIIYIYICVCVCMCVWVG